MPFQAYNHMLIVEEPIVNVRAQDVTVGYEFKLQYPSYRGTFLSCIEDIRFWVDGEELRRSDLVFILNGKNFLIDELAECFKEYWFILDYARLRVIKPGGISPGQHEVRVYLKHKIPYTGYFGEYMVLEADERKSLPVQ